MNWNAVTVQARANAELRERIARTPEWRKPAMRWHRVRVSPGGRSFFYRDRAGDLQPAAPGDVVVVDTELLELRRRDLEVLD